MALRLDLAEHDGKSKALLERLRDEYTPTPETLTELVELSAAEEKNVQTGATWLLNAYFADGATLDHDQVELLTSLLEGVDSGWARLHICQAVRYLDLGPEQATRFADFVRSCTLDRNTFVRAWATDAFVRLARRFPEFQAEAQRQLEKSLADPAGSIRARARRILEEDEPGEV